MTRNGRKLNQDDVRSILIQVTNEIEALRRAGQKEYAHNFNTPFRNFELLSAELDTTREKVLWTYFKKHLDGILAHIKGHKSQREDVFGRINDAIVYLILLRAMIEEDRLADGKFEWPSYIPIEPKGSPELLNYPKKD